MLGNKFVVAILESLFQGNLGSIVHPALVKAFTVSSMGKLNKLLFVMVHLVRIKESNIRKSLLQSQL